MTNHRLSGFICFQMNCLNRFRVPTICNRIGRQSSIALSLNDSLEQNLRSDYRFQRTISLTACCEKETPAALRNLKPKSRQDTAQHFVDIKQVKTFGGVGGDGAISFMRLWVNDRAGPDGGDGGHGGHVLFQVSEIETNIEQKS